jgi:hypothetical protein
LLLARKNTSEDTFRLGVLGPAQECVRLMKIPCDRCL